MADKTDLTFKKIVNRQYTTPDKQWYEEYSGIPFKLFGTDVWVETIPTTPPPTSTSIVEVFDTLTLQQDLTVGNQKSWLAENPIGTRIYGFIPPRYGLGYNIRLYDANDAEISTTDGSSWFFDYEAGVLTFDNDPGSFGWNDTAFKIKAYRYIGKTAQDILSIISGGNEVSAKEEIIPGVAPPSNMVLLNSPRLNSEIVMLNGVVLRRGVGVDVNDYQISGSTITFSVGLLISDPADEDVVQVFYEYLP